MKEIHLEQNRQLEFGLTREEEARAARRDERRVKRARWWFGQMRQAVNRAIDWSAAPSARPEQVYFPLPSPARRKTAMHLCG